VWAKIYSCIDNMAGELSLLNPPKTLTGKGFDD
jgi:hypothetical protein